MTAGTVSIGFMPTVRQRRIAIELRSLRETAGLNVEQVAELLNCDPVEMVAVEECRRPIPPETLGYLLRFGYRLTDPDYLGYFTGLAANGHRRDWTQMLVDDMPPYKDMDRALTLGAVGTWTYNPTAVPGILETGPHNIEIWA